ncbi:MAG: formylglycine-generating enzyme family protein [Pseudomonadota bacterium]
MISYRRHQRVLFLRLMVFVAALFSVEAPATADENDRIFLHDGQQLQGRLLLDQVRLETAVGAFVLDRSAIREITCPSDAKAPVTIRTNRGDRLTGFLEPWQMQVKADNGVTPIKRGAITRILLANASSAKKQHDEDHRIILKNGDHLYGRLQDPKLVVGDRPVDLAAVVQLDLGEAKDGRSISVVSDGASARRHHEHGFETISFRHWSGSDIRVSRASLASIETETDKRLAFRDDHSDGAPCPHCPLMQVIPPGDFLMGSPNAVDMNRPNEGPVHPVTIAYPFALGVHEISFDQWDACRADGVCLNRGADERFGRGSRPAISLSLADAKQFLVWLSDKTGHTYRLPTEAEWEYAARAGTTTLYYWGDEIGKSNAVCESCGTKWDNKRSAPTGSFPPNPFGLHDILGNAWEWTADCWNESYAGAPSDGSAWQDGDCTGHVMRGGAWFSFPVNLRTTTRFRGVVGNRYLSKGLRVARDF